VSGRYSTNEPSVHAFDLMVVDRYADDGISSARTVRHRYDIPPPPPGTDEPVVADAPTAPAAAGSRRSTARSVATRS
jgi:hypothetical protein